MMGEMADYYDDRIGPVDDSVECRYCGETGLEWSHEGGRWRLVDCDGELHACPRRPAGGR